MRPLGPLEAAPSIGDGRDSGDPGDHNFWAAAAIQPLDVVIGLHKHAVRACRTRIGMCHTTVPSPRTRGRTPVPPGHLRRYRERGTEEAWGSRTERDRPPTAGTPGGRLWRQPTRSPPRRRRVQQWPLLSARRRVSHTPRRMIATGYLYFFTRTCVWRNLSKATTVVQQGDHREGPT